MNKMKLLVIAGAVASIFYPIPQQYQHGTSVVVHFLDTQDQVDSMCGKADPAPNGDVRVKVGCETDSGIYIGNPCKYKDASDYKSFAHAMCHEIAHANGWRHEASG